MSEYDESEQPKPDSGNVVRPFFVVGGRARSRVDFPLEAVVAVRPDAPISEDEGFERAHIIDACGAPQSVAEVAVILGVPLGVARVLIGDLVADEILEVFEPASTHDVDLIERLIDGVRSL